MDRDTWHLAIFLLLAVLLLSMLCEAPPPMVIYPSGEVLPVQPEEMFRFTQDGFELRNTI